MASVFQFSVRGLLVAVTMAAVGIAALLNASVWLDALAWGAALLVLSTAVLLTVYRRQEQRAFWVGFTVFGGIYLLLIVQSFTADWKNDPLSSNPLHYNALATTKVMTLLYQAVLPDSRQQEQITLPASDRDIAVWNSDTGVAMNVPGQTLRVDFTTTVNSLAFAPDGGSVLISGNKMAPNPSYIPLGKFISIGHTLWLLLIAAVGGKVCRIVYRTRPKEPQS